MQPFFTLLSVATFSSLVQGAALNAKRGQPGCIYHFGKTNNAIFLEVGQKPQEWHDMIIWCEKKLDPEGKFPLVDPIDPVTSQLSIPKWKPRCHQFFTGQKHQGLYYYTDDYAKDLPGVGPVIKAHPGSTTCYYYDDI